TQTPSPHSLLSVARGFLGPLTHFVRSFAVQPTCLQPPHRSSPQASPADSLSRGSGELRSLVSARHRRFLACSQKASLSDDITKGARRLSDDYAPSLIPRAPHASGVLPRAVRSNNEHGIVERPRYSTRSCFG